MLTTDDLQAIKGIINEEMEPVKQQLNTVEMKVELVNKKVEQSQKETIESLSELMNSGYSLHEERIKKIEDTVHISHPQ